MHDAGAMDRLQTVEGLDGQPQRVPWRENAAPADQLREILAVDEFPHHVVGAIRKCGEVVERSNIRMLYLGGQPRLAEKAFVRIFSSRDLRPDDLHYASRAEKRVLDFVDLAHPARPQSLDDAVLTVDRFLEVAP